MVVDAFISKLGLRFHEPSLGFSSWIRPNRGMADDARVASLHRIDRAMLVRNVYFLILSCKEYFKLLNVLEIAILKHYPDARRHTGMANILDKVR